jgi:isopentenyl phosphate kinase
VNTPEQWLGFADVWKEARALNQIVVDALVGAGVPVIALPPSAAVTARDGQVLRWDLSPIRAALNAGLVPMVNGDVIFDELRGGTILSTEDLFIRLAKALSPGRILLAGREEGVFADFPARRELIRAITPANFQAVAKRIGGADSVDVTGGMIEKVRTMLDLVDSLPQFEARIFSGLTPGAVQAALLGTPHGTAIRRAEGDDIL